MQKNSSTTNMTESLRPLSSSYNSPSDLERLVTLLRIKCRASEYILIPASLDVLEESAKHAGGVLPSTLGTAVHRGQLDANKVGKDHLIGKQLELAGAHYFRKLGVPITKEPDCSIYEKDRKTFGPDLQIAGYDAHSKNTHWKTALGSLVSPSWTIQDTDWAIHAKNPNEYLMLGIVKGDEIALLGFPSCGLIGTKLPLHEMDNENLRDNKHAIYCSDLQRLTPEERWSLFLKIGLNIPRS